MDNKKIKQQLTGSSLFANLAEKELEAIYDRASEKEFSKGTSIVKKGMTGIGFYLILSGSVEVSSDDKQLAKLEEGDFFGELAVLDGDRRTANATALEDTRCLLLTQWELKLAIRRNPDVAIAMLQELAKRLRKVESILG